MDKNHDCSCKIILYITLGEMAESGRMRRTRNAVFA